MNKAIDLSSVPMKKKTREFLDTDLGQKVWAMLLASIQKMKNASDEGIAALFAIEEDLSQLFGISKDSDRHTKCSIGALVKIVMELNGYVKVTYIDKNGNVADKKRPCKNLTIFKTGQLYSVVSTGTKNF